MHPKYNRRNYDRKVLMMLKKHNKVWISTHGTGVPYLHVRIDTTPKYYQINKYKN